MFQNGFEYVYDTIGSIFRGGTPHFNNVKFLQEWLFSFGLLLSIATIGGWIEVRENWRWAVWALGLYFAFLTTFLWESQSLLIKDMVWNQIFSGTRDTGFVAVLVMSVMAGTVCE